MQLELLFDSIPNSTKRTDPSKQYQASKYSPQSIALLANQIEALISVGENLNSKQLFEMCDKAFGGTMGRGTYTSKDAYDSLELGLNQYIKNWNQSDSINFLPTTPDLKDAIIQVTYLKKLLDTLPTQTKRTHEMDRYQQFSTVPTLAYAICWLANITSSDVILEPSAGVGGLIAFAAKAKPTIYANELSNRRVEILKLFGVTKDIFTENAEHLNNALPPNILQPSF